MSDATLLIGDCLDVLKTFPDESVDSIVTDPPYGLRFMGHHWDYDVPKVEVWAECLRVLKPGGHLLAFSGTRTQHRMVVNIEDAGFEIRDMIAWVYGSGFPKSLDVSKAIDKAAGAIRTEILGRYQPPSMDKPWNLTQAKDKRNVEVFSSTRNNLDILAPATDAAKKWQGWGTALKPAMEPITVARKPLVGTVAANVLAHGTGAINVDGCRVALGDDEDVEKLNARSGGRCGFDADGYVGGSGDKPLPPGCDLSKGRWPANLIHDGSDEVLAEFPESAGAQGDVRGKLPSRTGSEGTNCYGEYKGRVPQSARKDSGSAARFFYCPKASKTDREADNNHPTVKPTDLMRYLCRLVTPPGGVVLDPFMGSGSTGKAAVLEGFDFMGVELDEGFAEIARRRISAVHDKQEQRRE